MKKLLFFLLFILIFAEFSLVYSQPNIIVLWEKPYNVSALKFTSDGQYLVTGGNSNSCSPYSCGNIKIWRFSDSSLVRSISHPDMGSTNDIVLTPDGQTIISAHGSVYCQPNGGCYADKSSHFRSDLNSGNIISSLVNLSEIEVSLDLSPNGSYLAVGTTYNNNGDIKIFDTSNNTLIRTLDGHIYTTNTVKFTNDSQTLISGGDDGKVKFWNVATGELIRTVVHGDYYDGGTDIQLALSPDGQFVASTGRGYDMKVKIWRISDGALIRTFNIVPENSANGFNCIQYSPNGLYIACGLTTFRSDLGYFGKLQFWNVSNGTLAREYLETTGSPNTGVRSIALSPSGNNHFAYGVSGKLKAAYTDLNLVTVTGTGTIGLEIPPSFKLYQNFPNPFNPTTKIAYDLPSIAHVSLKVFDILGNEVETLVNELQNAGSYSISFNSSKLAGGIYFYKLETEGFSKAKKMVLIK
ncbi:hypothetical protein BH10BAC5_BH10BAC5_23470 [soil metagenome]